MGIWRGVKKEGIWRGGLRRKRIWRGGRRRGIWRGEKEGRDAVEILYVLKMSAFDQFHFNAIPDLV